MAGRTVAAPPPPVNKIPVYGNSALGIPADSERFIRSVVRAAITNTLQVATRGGIRHDKTLSRRFHTLSFTSPS